MDLILDFNVTGEVLIPMENSNFLSDKKEITYKDLYECSYTQFRNVLFQGELIRFYILLKSDKINSSDIKNFYENIFFKIEFESTDTKNMNTDPQTTFSDQRNLETNFYDLFTTNSEKINEKNYEYENVERKEFDIESKIELYEVYKQIIVPKAYLNTPLIMKIKVMKKNEEVTDFGENSDTFLYYKTGHFSNVETFKVLKTLFKEIYVIKPVEVSKTKQIDLTLDLSLLQINLFNATCNIEYKDISLKKSRFLKKNNEQIENNLFGDDIIIKEIEILEDETSIDEKEIEKLDIVKKYLKKKNKLMQKDINFKLMETNLPVILKPGENYSLSVKVDKSCFLSDSDIKSNINSNVLPQINTNPALENNDTLGNNINYNNHNNNMINPSQQNEIKTRKRMNSNAIVISRKSIFNQASDRLLSLNNISAPLTTETPMPLPEIYQKTVGNNYLQKAVTMTEDNKTDSNSISLKDITEDNIKIYYITPVLLYVSSRMFYENLFLCLEYKWCQELNRLLKIETKIPKDIYLFDFFEVVIKIRNISSKPMNLLIEVKEDENEDKSSKVNNFEHMPSIISQIKFQSLGMFNCNENKIVKLRFLATKLGFTQLPNFAITDTHSNRRFYIVQNSKLFIQDNIRLNKENVLNRRISKTIC